jgi:hypothetical protein
MKRPYLSPELDSQYQLVAVRDGCFGLWGKTVFRAQIEDYTVIFRKHGFYATGQADGGEAIEISTSLPKQYTPLMRDISKGYLYTWLSKQPSQRTDLMEYAHGFLEFWKVKDNQLSLIIVWYRNIPDWSIIPECVQRFIKVANVIRVGR